MTNGEQIMTEYRVKPWEERRHPLTSRPPFVEPQLDELREQCLLLPPARPKPPAFWKLLAALLFELALLGLMYQMLDESLDLVGVSLSKHLIDDPIIGWIFSSVPGLTPRQVLALMMAFLFVSVPVYVWSEILGNFQDGEKSLGRVVVRIFLLAVYVFIVIAEYVLINHRIEAVQNNAFGAPVTLNETVAVFFSVLFILVNATAALVTASLLVGRKRAKGG